MSEELKFESPYDNRNEAGVTLTLDIDILARTIVREDYGFVRMLAALCREQREKWNKNGLGGTTPLIDLIEEKIKYGLFT